MSESDPQVPSHLSHVMRGQHWQLPSGALVSVRSIWFSFDDGQHCATVRHVTDEGVLAHGSFDVLLSLIARKGVQQK